jgi:hypothetical protein
VNHYWGNRIIFLVAAALTLPTILSVLSIRGDQINHERARGAEAKKEGCNEDVSSLRQLAEDPTLVIFLICAFLFHFANAAMLPQLGEMLLRGNASSAPPFMSACIIVTQAVITLSAVSIGRFANVQLLLVGFGVLPLRALLYKLTHWSTPLVAIQVLDGVANAIFGVVAILVAADRTRGTGRFNLAQGALAMAVGLGASLSNTFGGKLIRALAFASPSSRWVPSLWQRSCYCSSPFRKLCPDVSSLLAFYKQNVHDR